MIPRTKVWPGPRWLSLDLHIHSTYSGGSLSPTEILNWCGRSLLDGVAISDHNEVQGALEGQQVALGDAHLPGVVTSQEVSAGEHVHFLLIGSKQAQPDVRRHAIIDIIQKHRTEGGAVILAHPWTIPDKQWARSCLRELAEEGILDGMELCNASLLEFTVDPGRLVNRVWEEWIVPYHMGVVGGSDYHYLNKNRQVGSGRTYLKATEPGEPGIIEALRSRRCVGGLFNSRSIDLGWLGKGYSFMLGMEPWLTEVRGMARQAKEKINKETRYTPPLQAFLNNLVDAGHFQMVCDLMDYEDSKIFFKKS